MTIFYQVLRGKVRDVALAAPQPNPHLWVVVEAAGHTWFATVNVRSDKEPDGAPPGHANLYYWVDADFRHPLVPSILARPEGLSPSHTPLERSYDAGALDYQRCALFNPNAMRVLQPDPPGADALAERLTSLFALAKSQGQDVIFLWPYVQDVEAASVRRRFRLHAGRPVRSPQHPHGARGQAGPQGA